MSASATQGDHKRYQYHALLTYPCTKPKQTFHANSIAYWILTPCSVAIKEADTESSRIITFTFWIFVVTYYYAHTCTFCEYCVLYVSVTMQFVSKLCVLNNEILWHIVNFWPLGGKLYEGHRNNLCLITVAFGVIHFVFNTTIISKTIEDSRLRPPCATHRSPPQPNCVVYGEAYGRGMAVIRSQRWDGRSWSAEASPPLRVASRWLTSLAVH